VSCPAPPNKGTGQKDARLKQTLEKGALEYLTKERGLSQQQVSEYHHGNGVLRSAEAQEMLLDATRQYLARKGMANRPRAPLPPVHRFGYRLKPHPCKANRAGMSYGRSTRDS
jgi:hypothetical protein